MTIARMTMASYGRALSRGSCNSHSTTEMTVATSRMITRKFSNCSSSRFHHGVGGALFNWFGPCSASRRCASARLNPAAASEPSAATTALAGARWGTSVLGTGGEPCGGAASCLSSRLDACRLLMQIYGPVLIALVRFAMTNSRVRGGSSDSINRARAVVIVVRRRDRPDDRPGRMRASMALEQRHELSACRVSQYNRNKTATPRDVQSDIAA